MLPEERQHTIAEYIKKNGKAKVEELAEELGVSAMTIRRDLEKLDREGVVNRCHGGAVMQSEVKYVRKRATNRPTKNRIAERAAALVRDGMCVYIDAGTTTFELAKKIGKLNIQIVTNDVMLAAAAGNFKAEVFVCGGRLQKNTESLWGPYSVQMLEEFRFDMSFIGAAAIDGALNSLTPTPEKAFQKRAAVQESLSSCLMVDASKFGQTSFNLIANLADYDYVVTDYRFSEAQRTKLLTAGTQVLEVDG